jgi:hypothetical protein
MYYPLSQITTNLSTNGGEYIYSSTKENYKGSYFKTSKGEYFTGKTPQDGPNELLILVPLEVGAQVTSQNSNVSFVNTGDFEVNNYVIVSKQPTSAPPPPTYSPNIPTQQDYQIGEYRRYFCKKTNELIYLEIDKDTYDKLLGQDSTILYQLYQPFNLSWQLTGNAEQVYNVNKNITELATKNQKLPMLSAYLKMDFTKYYK